MGIFAVAALGLWPGIAAGYGYQASENPWKICAKHTQQQERAQRIPHRLLNAISLAETGRWRPETGEILAWPWTVMAEGEGRFFENKAAAVAWVRALRARGVANIDVGCMQVNLYYHGHQFASIEHAFDPDLNTAYAATFLRQKYRETRSWLMAAGHYHSNDGVKNKTYRDKVRRFWTGTETRTASADRGIDAGDTSPQTARYRAVQQISPIAAQHPQARSLASTVDRKRTEALNARFQQRIGATNGAAGKPLNRNRAGGFLEAQNQGKGASFADRRQAQLEYWR
ncbi:MAG: transglycosylase SLT domain-containing protein, partial [Rhodospirillales bacterium]